MINNNINNNEIKNKETNELALLEGMSDEKQFVEVDLVSGTVRKDDDGTFNISIKFGEFKHGVLCDFSGLMKLGQWSNDRQRNGLSATTVISRQSLIHSSEKTGYLVSYFSTMNDKYQPLLIDGNNVWLEIQNGNLNKITFLLAHEF